MPGKFITFEGVDGAGKSTHMEAVRALLERKGKNVVVTREPGGTELGEAIRALFLSREMSGHTEALLAFAARREHLERVIWPALARGDWVLCDRFTDSTLAYQGGGREIGVEHVNRLAEWVHPNFQPDLTLLFSVSPQVALDRLNERGVLDRIEAAAKDFHERVRATFLQLADRRESARRIAVITADIRRMDVEHLVLFHVRKLLVGGCDSAYMP
jgi:dTMP kinase